MSTPRFVQVPPAFLASIASDSERIPTLYYSRYWPVRHFFWMRLRVILQLMRRHCLDWSHCLDFGGGGGVFHPTLAGAFDHVTCIDLETAEAQQVRRRFGLGNVTLVAGDVRTAVLNPPQFPCVVAADVLEHFADLAPAVDAIQRWLSPQGRLFTSLPTESGLYVGLRKVFGVEKPADHHHTAAQVEDYLRSRGFERLDCVHVPLRLPLFSLFRISAWRRSAGA